MKPLAIKIPITIVSHDSVAAIGAESPPAEELGRRLHRDPGSLRLSRNLSPAPPARDKSRALHSHQLAAREVRIAVDPATHEHSQVQAASSIVVGLASSLRFFAAAMVYTAVVGTFLTFSFFGTAAGSVFADPTPVVQYIFAAGDGICSVALNLLIFTLAMCAAHHLQKAGTVHGHDREKTSRHLQKAILFLIATFNSLAVVIGLRTLVSLTSAAALYPLMVAVVAVSMLCIVVFLVVGFAVVQAWYGKSKWMGSGHLVDLLSASVEDLDQVPWFIKLWLYQMFGRVAVRRLRGSGAEAVEEGPCRLELLLEHYRGVSFSEEQMHVLLLLPESMMRVVAWGGYRVYASLLLVTTYLMGQLWVPAASEFLTIVKHCVAVGLLLNGAAVFGRALAEKGSDMQNLMRGFFSLRSTLSRIGSMFFVTMTIQAVLQMANLILEYQTPAST